MTRPNGINTNYSYDNLSRLLSVLHQSGASTIDGASYTLDSAGNRTAKTDDYASVTSNYTYDALYELTQVTKPSTTTESYSYDPVGNRTASLGVPSYTTNSSNEMTANSNANYSFDANGNTTSKTDSTGTTDYAWDYENRLTSVTLPGSAGTVSFTYDPFGRRIYKQSPTATSVFVYDGDNLIETTNGSGSEVASYTQTTNIDQPLAMLRGATTDYYEADGLGSVTSLSNTSGTLAQTYTYDSFGNATNSSGSLTNFFRYTGREFDTETGLYYYRARYDDPLSGRFVNEDPVGDAGGLNHYAYAVNNPIVIGDLFGLCPNSNCVKPNFLNRLEIPILRSIAQSQNQTVGIGLNISGGLGEVLGIGGGWSGFLVVSPNGQAGFAFTWSSTPLPVGPVWGVGALAGAAYLQSDAMTPNGLGGDSVDYGGSVADGLGAGVDVSVGSAGLTTVQTAGFGFGGNGHGLVIGKTIVLPICP